MAPEQIRRRVESWRQLIVPEWSVVLKSEPGDDIAPEDLGRGRCETNPALRSVKVMVNTPRIDNTVDLDETIVHELLHAAFDDLLEGLRSHLVELAPQTAMAIRRQLDSLNEPLVERLARIIVSHGHPGSVYKTQWDLTENPPD